MEPLHDLIHRARAGDLEAFGSLVRSTQAMAYAVARGVLRDGAAAEDAAQEAYLRAFRRLGELSEPAAFVSWLRRIVVTVALNMRRGRRHTFLRLEDVPDVPVLDEAETRWSELQRRRLSGALLTLGSEDRQLCDRRYHGGWSTSRLAAQAGVDEAAMRKRLQRIRDRLRKEMEVIEQRDISADEIRPDFPAKVVELLARPQLTALPENPVGRILEQLRGVFTGCTEIALPEIVDFTSARRTIGDDALYVDASELHRLDANRILRYDLTLPLLLTVRYEGKPLRLWASGKAYRLCQVDAMHLDAFHQAEVLCLDERVASGSLADHRSGAAGRRPALPGPANQDRADQLRDVQPGVGDRGRRRRPLVRGARVGQVHRQDRRPPRRGSRTPHRRRRRLRAGTAGDAALRDRRHPQDRDQ